MSTSQRVRDHEKYMRNRTEEDIRLQAIEDAKDRQWLADHPLDPNEAPYALEDVKRYVAEIRILRMRIG